MNKADAGGAIMFSISISPKALKTLARIGDILEIDPNLILVAGPPVMAMALESMAQKDVFLAGGKRRGKNTTDVLRKPLKMPTVEEFRATPTARAFDATIGELGGVQADGAMTRVFAEKAEIETIRVYARAASDAEAFGYASWCVFSLLNSEADIYSKGGRIGFCDPNTNSFYSISEWLAGETAKHRRKGSS